MDRRPLDCMRCTGLCCRDFTLLADPSKLQFYLKLFKKTGNKRYEDPAKVAEMVVFLRYDISGLDLRGYSKKFIDKRWHYTCKYYDSELGLCMNYLARPYMCRRYPESRCLYFPLRVNSIKKHELGVS